MLPRELPLSGLVSLSPAADFLVGSFFISEEVAPSFFSVGQIVDGLSTAQIVTSQIFKC